MNPGRAFSLLLHAGLEDPRPYLDQRSARHWFKKSTASLGVGE